MILICQSHNSEQLWGNIYVVSGLAEHYGYVPPDMIDSKKVF